MNRVVFACFAITVIYLFPGPSLASECAAKQVTFTVENDSDFSAIWSSEVDRDSLFQSGDEFAYDGLDGPSTVLIGLEGKIDLRSSDNSRCKVLVASNFSFAELDSWDRFDIDGRNYVEPSLSLDNFELSGVLSEAAPTVSSLSRGWSVTASLGE